MKWLKRVVLALVALTVISGAALVIMVRFLPETDFIRNAVESRLRDLTGQNITIASIDVGGSFPDLMRITLQGVAATSPDGQKQLSMDRLVLVPSVTPLLRREISIASITVEGLHTFVRRLPDGTVLYPLVIAPVSSPGSVREDAAGPREDIAKQSPGTAPSGLRWSIESIVLSNGRVDFIDGQATPESNGTPVISFKGFNASLKQQTSGNAFAVSVFGHVAGAKAEAGTVDLKGDVTLTGDLSALQRATATVTCESFRLEPFHRFIPIAQETVSQFRLSATRFSATWEKSQPCTFSFESRVTGNGEGAHAIAIKGSGKAPEDLSQVETIAVTGETEGFPLNPVASLLPPGLPWQEASGALSANVQGTFHNPAEWNVQGQVALADLSPKGIMAALGKRMGVKAEFSLDPGLLTVKGMEISETTQRLATVSGNVRGPFSTEPALDLTVDAIGRPQWLKGLGIRLPDHVSIAGTIPVRARVSGPVTKVSLETHADLTPATIRVKPVLEKTEGEKASISVQTTLTEAQRAHGSKSALALRVGLHMPSVRVQLRAADAALAGFALNLNSGVIVKGKTVDIKDALLTLKRAQQKSPDDLTVNADIENVASLHPRLKGTATVLLNKENMALATGALPPNLTLAGETRGKLAFSGSTTALDWSLEVPLTSMAVDVEKAFHKPAGMNAHLKASGKWADESLKLERGQLSLAGISATGSGVLKERSGGFGGLRVQVKKADMKDVVGVVPALTRGKVSGPVEADLELKSSREGIVPHASVRLVAVDYQADKNEWSFNKVRGVARINGRYLNVPELTGVIKGAVDAPLKVTGTIHNVDAVKEMNGQVTLEMGKGKINADRFRKILQPMQLLVGSLLDPKALGKKTDVFELESGTGTFDIKSGVAQTSNLRLKGADFGVGAIGSIRLHDVHLDALAGLHTVIVTNDAIGRIPEVRNAVKKYEGILKATGLDKELKKVGIDVDDKGETKQEAPKEVRTPVTVIVKIQGPASSPQVMPVAENTLGTDTANKLKLLMN